MNKYTRFLKLLEEKDYLRSGIIIKDLLANSKYGHYAHLDGFLSWLEQNDTLSPEEKKYELDKFEKFVLKLSLSGSIFKISQVNMDKINERLNSLKETNNNLIKLNKDKEITELKTGNSEILKYLEEKLDEIDKVETKDEFDSFLIEIKNIENRLVINKLDENDEFRYNKLIDAYASKITSLTNYFSNIDLREYNLKALDDFKTTLDLFKKNKRKYRKDENLFSSMLKEHFFIYDINKLYKETNEFYSYTYNYIFNRLDTEDKYLMAELALNTKKI